ncbi:glycosyltransferase family 87 protein [Paraburkholderia sp. RL18-085-BIA-A]|jgi:hypothetical protein|uniref:glycosyltransferase family 87 protein n=3 Tax=unclassified Paraburkholderia TaxID=2615204 RepID=UPI002F86CB33
MFNTRAIRAKSGLSFSAGAIILLVIAVGCLAIHVLHLYVKFRANPPDAFGDFNFYLYAFNTVLEDPARLYDHDGLVAFLQGIGARSTGDDVFYAYPPQFALLFSPLALLTPLAAKFVWMSMSLVLFAIGVLLIVKMAYRGDERGVPILLVAIALLSFPLVEDAYDGQSNQLLFFLLAATFFLVDRGNRYVAGLVLGLAIVLKLTPLAIAGLLLLRREWRTFIAAMVVSIALTVITAVQVGPGVVLQYFLSDMPRLSALNQLVGGGGLPSNNSLRGAFQTLSAQIGMPMSSDMLTLVSLAFALAACLLSAYLVFRRHEDSRMDYALAAMTMLMAYPVLEPIHLLVALIPLLILFGTALESESRQLSAIKPKVELLLAAIAVLILFFAAKFVSYTVASLIIYGLCVARYFAPKVVRRRHRPTRFA